MLAPSGAVYGWALSPRREWQEDVGSSPAPLQVATASGSGRQSPHLVAGPRLGCSQEGRTSGFPDPGA